MLLNNKLSSLFISTSLVSIAFAAWAVERKIGTLEFATIAVFATFIGSLFVWLGAKFLNKGHVKEEKRS